MNRHAATGSGAGEAGSGAGSRARSWSADAPGQGRGVPPPRPPPRDAAVATTATRSPGRSRAPAPRLGPLLLVRVLAGLAGLIAVLALGHTLLAGVLDRSTALAFGLLIALGEFARWRQDDGIRPVREPAPLGAAGALAYALLDQVGGHPAGQGVPQVVAVVVAASLAGGAWHVACDRGSSVAHLTRRVLGTAFAAVCAQPLHALFSPGRGHDEGAAYALGVVAVLALTALCDVVLCAALARGRTGRPYGSLLRDELRGLAGIGSAVGATGAVMALGVAVAALWALPLFSLPLLLTQLAFRRYAAARTTYRQTVASLARATEIAGCTPAGHARRVAALSRALGHELGLSGRELSVVEQAALLHDIGQLSLVDPVPEGATSGLPEEQQRRIALLGAAVVRRTGGAAEVARIVEQQAEPYRDQSLPARVVRTANAYDELVRARDCASALTALECLRLATGRDHQPEVVECLARVVRRESFVA